MAAPRKAAARTRRTRGRLAPGQQARGLDAAQVAVALDDPAVAELAQLVRTAGGAPIGAYREPLGGRAAAAGEPAVRGRAADALPARPVADARQAPGRGRSSRPAAFLDPLIVVRGEDGRLWTPNGRHRLAAAKVLGLKQITALISRRRLARLPHPRAQHREGPQPQGPQPRGDPHGTQSRQAARARARAGSSPRSSRRPNC